MGATVFRHTAWGETAREAFVSACDAATEEYGTEPYSGTIKEKSSFVDIEVPPGEDPIRYADQLVDNGDPRVDDKWGPAGCVQLGENHYYFFGWASE